MVGLLVDYLIIPLCCVLGDELYSIQLMDEVNVVSKHDQSTSSNFDPSENVLFVDTLGLDCLIS